MLEALGSDSNRPSSSEGPANWSTPRHVVGYVRTTFAEEHGKHPTINEQALALHRKFPGLIVFGDHGCHRSPSMNARRPEEVVTPESISPDDHHTLNGISDLCDYLEDNDEVEMVLVTDGSRMPAVGRKAVDDLGVMIVEASILPDDSAASVVTPSEIIGPSRIAPEEEPYHRQHWPARPDSRDGWLYPHKAWADERRLR